MEKILFFFSWIGMGSSYLSPYAYGIMHRMHHAYADTEKDPHSPLFDGNLFSMMWRTKKIYSAIAKFAYPVEERFLKNVPEWRSFDLFASSWPSRTFWFLVYLSVYIIYADAWYYYLLLPFQALMGPVHGAIINWFAHKYGYRNFEISDTSKNFLPVDFLMLGESYHNNHHKRGSNPNFGFRWFELDPIYPIIRVFDVLGVIRLKNT